VPRSSEWFFPSGSPTRIVYVFLMSPMHVTRPVYLILQTISVEVYKLLNCSLCSLLQLSATSSISGPNTREYPKVSGLAFWSENCNWYSSLSLCAVVSLFCESV
jgi:hypothetical protein